MKPLSEVVFGHSDPDPSSVATVHLLTSLQTLFLMPLTGILKCYVILLAKAHLKNCHSF